LELLAIGQSQLSCTRSFNWNFIIWNLFTMIFNFNEASQPILSKPIFIIGAGGIVNDAHLPAYKIAGFKVTGIFDKDIERAKSLAAKFGIKKVFKTLAEMLANATNDVVFDVAVPGNVIASILEQLPVNATVLIQKPMGNNMEEANQILQIAREKHLNAGINFQLRYAPFIMASRKIINGGLIGEVCGIDIYVNVFTPWHLWNFLFNLPRMEILYHSIHYIDLIRSLLGNPKSVFAKTVKHPAMKNLASVKSNIIMDYGDSISANIITNHTHFYGAKNQDAFIEITGTKGAIKIKLGLLMNYPTGESDTIEYIVLEEDKKTEWQSVEISGGWFPHAFIGSMWQMMQAANGANFQLDNSVEDAIYTMACVEAAYKSNEIGGVKLA
jgi:predicted dehydrogenase